MRHPETQYKKQQEEGIILAKNEDKVLPVTDEKKLNVFGWASTTQSMEDPVPELLILHLLYLCCRDLKMQDLS